MLGAASARSRDFFAPAARVLRFLVRICFGIEWLLLTRLVGARSADLDARTAIKASFLRLAHRWSAHSDSILANVLLWADPQAHARKELYHRIVSNTVAGHA